MKTSIETLANLLATVIWADGEYDETEKDAVVEIAEALKIDKASLNSAVDSAVKNISSLDEAKVSEFAEAAAKAVDKDEAKIVFETVIEIALADGIIASAEVENIHEIGAALGLSAAEITLLLVDMVADEDAFSVEVEA